MSLKMFLSSFSLLNVFFFRMFFSHINVEKSKFQSKKKLLSYNLLKWSLKLINILTRNQFCIPGLTSTWSWNYIIRFVLLISCLGSASMFMSESCLLTLLSYRLILLVLKQASITKWNASCSYFFLFSGSLDKTGISSLKVCWTCLDQVVFVRKFRLH